MTRARDIKLIHIARQALGMDEDTYRQVLARYGKGKTSCTDLSDTQLSLVVRHMKACGFVVQPRRAPTNGAAPRRGEPQLAKLRALWWALADVQAVQRPADAQACEAAIETWALRQLAGRDVPLQALRFASLHQRIELTEQLKRWCRRVGARTDGTAADAIPADQPVSQG